MDKTQIRELGTLEIFCDEEGGRYVKVPDDYALIDFIDGWVSNSERSRFEKSVNPDYEE